MKITREPQGVPVETGTIECRCCGAAFEYTAEDILWPHDVFFWTTCPGCNSHVDVPEFKTRADRMTMYRRQLPVCSEEPKS
jgi:hypothetical protein